MKTVRFVVAYEIEQEVPDDWDDDLIAFHYEENHCLDNHVDTLHRRIEANPGICQTCSIGRAVVGVTLDEIAAAPALVRALLAVEWHDEPSFGILCPACGGVDPSHPFPLNPSANGHQQGCPVDAALTAAGLPDQASRDAARAEIAKAPATS